MATVVTINHCDEDHLAAVIAEMKVRGAPVLRAIRDEVQGITLALEGSHRVEAAKRLGLMPVFKYLDDDDMITCKEIGYDDNEWFDGEPARAADIRERIGSPMGMYAGCVFHEFEAV